MTNGEDKTAPTWTLPGYGNSIPVLSPTGQGIEWVQCEGGLTKRELATFMAMQGLLGAPTSTRGNGYVEDIARTARRVADATIAELARG